MARAGRDRQHLWKDVEIAGREERRLLGIAILILIERGVVALNTGILDVCAGECADVRQAAGIAIARRAWRGVRGARGDVLVHPSGLVVELVVLVVGADDA